MILVTGANSFVGKCLIQELEKNKIKYLGVDLNIKKKKNLKKIDIRDAEISKYIKSNTTIIHLAAISTDKLCETNPNLAFDVNVNGTMNLINIANKKKAKKFIFASTEWVYGNLAEKLQKENDEIKIESLNSLYAITKAIGEKLILNKNNKFKKIILRFGIIYGNRKKNFSALESIFLNCAKNRLIEVGSKKTSRRFIHVLDIVRGIIKTFNYEKNSIFNLTGSKDITLEDIIKISEKHLNRKFKIKEKNKKLISTRKPSNYKFRKETGWLPEIDLQAGIFSLKNYFKII